MHLLHLILTFSLTVLIAAKLPTFGNQAVVDTMIQEIISDIEDKVNVEQRPRYAQEDARDIIAELREELLECKRNFIATQSMADFKACVHGDAEDARDKIWELEKNLYPASGSVLLSSLIVLILSKLISALF